MAIDLQKIQLKFDALFEDENLVTDFEKWLEARNVSQNNGKPIVIRSVCECGNELTEKELFYETCLQCGATPPNAAKPHVIFRFSFGEWVLIDNEVSGQIVDFYGDDWWMVDVNGKWGAVDGNRLTKDNRYVSANGI